MTGSKQTPAAPAPTGLTMRRVSRVLEISFDDGREFSLPFELLRVYSPSAEVRGHGQGQEVLEVLAVHAEHQDHIERTFAFFEQFGGHLRRHSRIDLAIEYQHRFCRS